MTAAVPAPALTITLFRLGRVSNLPTVWTNVLAGAALAGTGWTSRQFALILVAMSLFYVGGMYLNDYCDRTIDARERPERPIPSGAISARSVAAIAGGLLVAGLLLIAATGAFDAIISALVLAALIAFYDINHKGNLFAPVVMGACRALVYVTTAAALGGAVTMPVIAAAVAVAAYVAGLTYAARQESLDNVGNLWPLALLAAPMLVAWRALAYGPGAIAIYLLLPVLVTAAVWLLAKRAAAGSVSRAVGWLIAGISLCDAALLAAIDETTLALVAVGGFAATRVAQKYVAGT